MEEEKLIKKRRHSAADTAKMINVRRGKANQEAKAILNHLAGKEYEPSKMKEGI